MTGIQDTNIPRRGRGNAGLTTDNRCNYTLALRRGIRILRVQSRRPCHTEGWSKQSAIRGHGRRFFLQIKGARRSVGALDLLAPATPARYLTLIFFGSQTSAFFFTTAPQSLQRKRPGLGLAEDSPFLQLISVRLYLKLAQRQGRSHLWPSRPSDTALLWRLPRVRATLARGEGVSKYAGSRLVHRQR